MFPGKISYCTPVRGRLRHLMETLPHNLKHTDDDTEHLIVAYGDREVDQWVKARGFQNHPKVRYVYLDGPQRYEHGHGKNYAHKQATGDFLVNLDADNVLGDQTHHQLRHAVTVAPTPIFATTTHPGFIGMFRDHFLAIGGYDERMNFAGGVDVDLKARATALGFRAVAVEPGGLLVLRHDNATRLEHTGQTVPANWRVDNVIVKTIREYEQMTRHALATGKLVANQGKEWGVWPVHTP